MTLDEMEAALDALEARIDALAAAAGEITTQEEWIAYQSKMGTLPKASASP